MDIPVWSVQCKVNRYLTLKSRSSFACKNENLFVKAETIDRQYTLTKHWILSIILGTFRT